MSRRRGPVGAVVGLIGTGVGFAAEYHQHRKQLKQERAGQATAQVEEQDVTVQESARSTEPGRIANDEAPPDFSEEPVAGQERSLAHGGPSHDKKDGDLGVDIEDEDAMSSIVGDELSIEDDEEDWELDEAVSPPSYEASESYYGNTEDLVRDVLSAHGPDAFKAQERQPLPLPVILPQRRPRNKARGFVRAYAPVLEGCGIDQATFLAFLDNFQKSSSASPIFNVIQISAAIAGMAPSVIAMVVSTIVQTAAAIGKEVQARQRTNNFLDRMNEELFKPAGLYAFIVKYKSDADVAESMGSRFGFQSQTVDMSTNQIIAKFNRTISDELNTKRSLGDKMKGLRLTSGSTHGSAQLPAAAELIFPDIDRAVATNGAEETFKDKANDARAFLQDYLDRRAQLRYAQDDPNSTLAVPESQRAFKSKLADPNHPMFQGGLITLATGGMVSPRAMRRRDRAQYGYYGDPRMGMGGPYDPNYSDYYNQDAGYGRGGRGDPHYDPYAGYGRRGRRRQGRSGLITTLVTAAADAVKEVQARKQGMDPPNMNETSKASTRPDTQSRELPPVRAFDDERLPPAELGRAPYPPYPGYDPRGRRGGNEGPIGAVRRLIREDVLYLMVVNLPSEEELAVAREELAAAKAAN